MPCKEAIIRVDGGICSQISFFVMGKYLEDLGYDVSYDIGHYDFTKEYKFARNFDMPLAFPDLKIKYATKEDIVKLKKYDNVIPPDGASGYICGYPKERTFIHKYKDYFVQHFHPVDADSCQEILEDINNSVSCGIHARRGDLSTYNPVYGYATPVSYFLKSIKIIHSLHPDVKFFLFSEEPDWIENEIIPHIDKNINYKICSQNGSDKGYLDLMLMMRCKYLVASIGSLAIFARYFSSVNELIILDRYYDRIVKYYDNVIVLNDTILINSGRKK